MLCKSIKHYLCKKLLTYEIFTRHIIVFFNFQR